MTEREPSVASGDPAEPQPPSSRAVKARLAASLARATPGWLAVALAVVVLVSLVMFRFRAELGVLNVLLIYLLITFFLALNGGLWPAVLAAVLGFLTLDFLFIPPYLTFTIAGYDHLLALFAYLGVAIFTARLVSRVKERTESARRETRRVTLLSELNAALIGDVTLTAMLATIAERVVTVYGAAGCRVLVPGPDGALTGGGAYPAAIPVAVDRASLALAEWAREHRRPIGRSRRGRKIVGAPAPLPGGAEGRGRSDILFLPIMTPARVAGVLEVIGRPGAKPFHAEDERLLGLFVDQAALALERARLSEEAAQAAVLAKSDELKSALLAAVSHDLRTPLASIKASATSLLDASIPWDSATRQEFLTGIDEETDRLTLMVSNLLDLSRIEGGALRPQKDWYDIEELVRDVERRLAGRLSTHPVQIQIEPDLPLLSFDYVEIAQVLVNLLENAVKYTPLGTAIAIDARAIPGAVEISVRDEGPGISLSDQANLFDKFYRGHSETAVAGSGIGLAISKGLVEAHGGRIRVKSAPGAGTTFAFTLPQSAPAPEPAAADRVAAGHPA